MDKNADERIIFDENVTYEIGNKKAIVSCNFNQNGKETVSEILSKLIQADIENI